MAQRIPGAKLVELPGDDHLVFLGDSEAVVGEIQEFLTGARTPVAHETTLATVMFVDIEGSTQKAAALGDALWRDLLIMFHRAVRHELERHRGRLIDTAGDGAFASFDGSARAIQCDRAIADRVADLGLKTRAGVHTGECQIVDGKLAGMAVHIGARIAAGAQPGQVCVSSTVKDLADSWARAAGMSTERSVRGRGIVGT